MEIIVLYLRVSADRATFGPSEMAGRKQYRVIALGKLRWSLRRIEEATGVRRENRECLPKNSRDGGAPARVGTPSVGKTGHEGDHRPRWVKSGHRGHLKTGDIQGDAPI